MALLKVKSHEVASRFKCEGWKPDVLKNEIDRGPFSGSPTLRLPRSSKYRVNFRDRDESNRGNDEQMFGVK
jgi:hypothetical protein